MLTSSSTHPRSFLMTTVLSVARSRVTRGPAYGAVTPKLVMPSSFRAQFSREASDAAASASLARVRTRMSAAAPIAPVAAHSRRRWVRAGLRPQQSRQAPVFAAAAAPSRARWGRNVFFASAGIGCAIGVIGAATSPASPAGAWFFSSPPTGATSVIVALQAVAAAAQMVAELGAAVLASVAARGSDLGRWVGVGAVGSRTHADGSGGDPQLWWLAGDKTDDGALLGWLSSGTERAGSVAARLERFGAWCVGSRTAHQEEAGDAIPMLAMFTAPLFMLLYALLCCF